MRRVKSIGGGGNRTHAGRCETPSRIAPLPRNRLECLGVAIPPRPLLSRSVPGHSAVSCDRVRKIRIVDVHVRFGGPLPEGRDVLASFEP
jgi:hypothetical protein